MQSITQQVSKHGCCLKPYSLDHSTLTKIAIESHFHNSPSLRRDRLDEHSRNILRPITRQKLLHDLLLVVLVERFLGLVSLEEVEPGRVLGVARDAVVDHALLVLCRFGRLLVDGFEPVCMLWVCVDLRNWMRSDDAGWKGCLCVRRGGGELTVPYTQNSPSGMSHLLWSISAMVGSQRVLAVLYINAFERSKGTYIIACMDGKLRS